MQLPDINTSYNLLFVGTLKTSLREQQQLIADYTQKFQDHYEQQPTWKKVALWVLVALGLVAVIVVAVLHVYIIQLLVLVSDKLAGLKHGHLLLFVLIFFVGFPPLIGFSALSMLTGMVYGFPGGWPLLASASILGSLCLFLVFRYLLKAQAEHMIHSNEKFRAFAEILREDSSLFLLVLIRLCPLPYSLSNGALAAIPELPILTYFSASIITSPKLFIHIFVGNKIKELGDVTKSLSTKIFDIVSIVITGLAASLTTYIIYNKMQQKLRAYHSQPSNELVFGNFDDEDVALTSGDYDEDNFIITDD